MLQTPTPDSLTTARLWLTASPVKLQGLTKIQEEFPEKNIDENAAL